MDLARSQRLLAVLRQRSPQTAAQLMQALGLSQPALSRLIAADEQVLRIGRARASRYVLARAVGRAGWRWPLYRIDIAGRAYGLGELRALHADAFHFEPAQALPALLQGEFAQGLFPGLPWFMDDLRPQGFLGRGFARSVAAEIDAPEDLQRWRADDVVLALLRHGHDLPGDLVLGEAALQHAHRLIAMPADAIAPDLRAARYPILAEAALRGDAVGSSAAGEQPKFLTTLLSDDGYMPVIVKFSERTHTPTGRRWADLLYCEQIAGEVLRTQGVPAAESEIVAADGRVFLQSRRFDRTPRLGRRGFVSLSALDAAFFAHAHIDWWRLAPRLEADGWIAVADARHLRLLGWFGALIANSDMHLGNVALLRADARPFALAPAYDMLPMHYRPAVSGEVVPREYTVQRPPPAARDDWQQAAVMARAFWQRVSESTEISVEFRRIARAAGRALAAVL